MVEPISPENEEHCRTRFLAGDTLAEIHRSYGGSISKARIKAIRDSLFLELNASADNVKALANGPCLNPLDIVRYKSARQTAKPDAKITQIEMFNP